MPIESKIRKIYSFPPYSLYKPPRIPLSDLEKITITLEEFEALKLVDYENLPQREAAISMNVSQATFNRVLKNARTKIVSVLVLGQVLVLEGGNNILPCRIFRCTICSYQWSPNEEGPPKFCPACNSDSIVRVHE